MRFKAYATLTPTGFAQEIILVAQGTCAIGSSPEFLLAQTFGP